MCPSDYTSLWDDVMNKQDLGCERRARLVSSHAGGGGRGVASEQADCGRYE